MPTCNHHDSIWPVLRGLLRSGWKRFMRLVGRPRERGDSRHLRGRRAEEAAAKHLKNHGYRILERNFSCSRGELDLVAFREGTVAFVEVRSRTRPALLDPLATVTRAKQRRIIRAARRFATLRSLRRDELVLRFDVVAVIFSSDGRVEELRHVENAFTL